VHLDGRCASESGMDSGADAEADLTPFQD
jgi:hypothetical protein